MVKPIVRDTMLLMRKSTPAGRGDLQTARDLLDTLKFHTRDCVGLAANMIGVFKTIIAVSVAGVPMVMINPQITGHSSESYEAEEGCLSLDGTRIATRWKTIEVDYLDMTMRKRHGSYTGFPAQIIQHEMDHCRGILI